MANPQLEQASSLYDAILDEISSGKLVGGQRLKISELAERYGVSASPVRETLRQMQGEGFVEIQQNRGAIVRQADASTIQNTFEILQLLEPYFVGWFAEHAQPEMIDELDVLQGRMKANGGQDIPVFRKMDSDFHEVICAHHYNDVAADAWRKLRKALSVHAAPLRISPARMRAIITEHDALIAAFREGDPETADEVIRKHVEGSYRQMSQQMRALGI